MIALPFNVEERAVNVSTKAANSFISMSILLSAQKPSLSTATVRIVFDDY